MQKLHKKASNRRACRPLLHFRFLWPPSAQASAEGYAPPCPPLRFHLPQCASRDLCQRCPSPALFWSIVRNSFPSYVGADIPRLFFPQLAVAAFLLIRRCCVSCNTSLPWRRSECIVLPLPLRPEPLGGRISSTACPSAYLPPKPRLHAAPLPAQNSPAPPQFRMGNRAKVC